MTSLALRSKLAAVAAAALLAACGGSDHTALHLGGVAATGLAIEGGTVTVQCKSGTGSADQPTDAAGRYTVRVVDGTGPCLVTVSKGSLTLRSIANPDANGQAVANVTPITNAIVNAIAAAKGTTVEGLTGTQAPSSADINNAADQVLEVLTGALGINAPSGWGSLTAEQLLSDPNFTAATTSNPTGGSVLDQAMDVLVTENKLTPSSGALSSTITDDINAQVQSVVDPTPTGGTGAGN